MAQSDITQPRYSLGGIAVLAGLLLGLARKISPKTVAGGVMSLASRS